MIGFLMSVLAIDENAFLQFHHRGVRKQLVVAVDSSLTARQLVLLVACRNRNARSFHHNVGSHRARGIIGERHRRVFASCQTADARYPCAAVW